MTRRPPKPVSSVDVSWAHRAPARALRTGIILYLLGPILEHYTHARVVGEHHLERLRPPVVFAANHSSHIDTPLLLRALPARWRNRTAVAAAADYFFRNKLIAWLVSLAFGAVPIERNAPPSRHSTRQLNDLLSSDGNVLVYPEGTRSRDGRMGPLRSGAARLALEHRAPLVPIYLWGTHEAMPPGRWWPRRHQATIAFGEPIHPRPGEDPKSVTARLEIALAALRSAHVRDD
jgi:1-acyl-sn-glycerol-3-phosphate acyltransferase